MTASPNVIAVTGASGFIGRAVVRELLNAGYQVRALVRSETHWPFCDHPRLLRHSGDIRDVESLKHLLDGSDGVIHLAVRKYDEDDSESINVDGARNLVGTCEQVKIPWIINLSSQSAKLQHAGPYGRTKREADAVFQASKIPVTTLMLSLVYGPGQSGVFRTLVSLASLPITPIIGGGDATFHPIHVDDVASMIRCCIETPGTRGHTYDAGGNECLSLREIIQSIKRCLGKKSRMLSLPIQPLLLTARILSLLRHPPVTVSNIRGAMENVSMYITQLRALTHDTPRTFDQGLKNVLSPPPYDVDEARTLLRYCMAPSGIAWDVTDRDIDHYRRALDTQHIAPHRLDEKFLRSEYRLTALDWVCAIRKKPSILRQKLIVAGGLVETHPLSSGWLLPKRRSLFSLGIDIGVTALKLLTLLPYSIFLVLSPNTLKRNAGL